MSQYVFFVRVGDTENLKRLMISVIDNEYDSVALGIVTFPNFAKVESSSKIPHFKLIVSVFVLSY